MAENLETPPLKPENPSRGPGGLCIVCVFRSGDLSSRPFVYVYNIFIAPTARLIFSKVLDQLIQETRYVIYSMPRVDSTGTELTCLVPLPGTDKPWV